MNYVITVVLVIIITAITFYYIYLNYISSHVSLSLKGGYTVDDIINYMLSYDENGLAKDWADPLIYQVYRASEVEKCEDLCVHSISTSLDNYMKGNYINGVFLFYYPHNSCYIAAYMNHLALMLCGHHLTCHKCTSNPLLYNANEAKEIIGVNINDDEIKPINECYVNLKRFLIVMYQRGRVYTMPTGTILKNIEYLQRLNKLNGIQIPNRPGIPITFLPCFILSGITSFAINVGDRHNIAISVIDGKYYFVHTGARFVGTWNMNNVSYYIGFNELRNHFTDDVGYNWNSAFIELVSYRLLNQQQTPITQYNFDAYKPRELLYAPVDGYFSYIYTQAITKWMCGLIVESPDYIFAAVYTKFNELELTRNYHDHHQSADDDPTAIVKTSKYMDFFDNQNPGSYYPSPDTVFENKLTKLYKCISVNWHFENPNPPTNAEKEDLVAQVSRSLLNTYSTDASDEMNHSILTYFNPNLYMETATEELKQEACKYFKYFLNTFITKYYPLGLAWEEQHFYNLIVKAIYDISNDPQYIPYFDKIILDKDFNF